MVVAVILGVFGNYHMARLKECVGLPCSFAPIEIAGGRGSTNVPGWRVPDSFFRRSMTLFPGCDYGNIPKKSIRDRLRAAMDAVNPEAVVVCGWDFAESVAALRWSRRNGVPCILMSDSTQRDAKRHWCKEWLKGRLVRCFSAALVGGKPQKDYVVKLGMTPERVFTGYDAVDNEYFSRQAEAVRAKEQDYRAAHRLPPRYFLTSNRFTAVKNLFRLLAAYAKYRQHVSDPWDLVLLGDGELMPEVRRSIEELHLQECVVLPGFKQYGELPVYYGLASCLILASTSETWGLVVNEAMASGLPVLVSKACGCCEDLVREGENGFSFDPLSVDEMAEKMRMISHGEYDLAKMGQASQEIIANWGCDNFARNLWRAAQCACERPVRNRDPVASAMLHILTTVR